MIKERGRQRVEEVGNHIIFETDSVAEKGSMKSSMQYNKRPAFANNKKLIEIDSDDDDDVCQLFRVQQDSDAFRFEDTESQKGLSPSKHVSTTPKSKPNW